MGKRIISQRRGRGGRYKSVGFRFIDSVKHRDFDKNIKGNVVDIVHCPGHTAPLAVVVYEDGVRAYLFAVEGLCVGDVVACGKGVPLANGSIMPLGSMPEGSFICNIEGVPGDGGSYVRAAGGSAKIVSKAKDNVVVLLPTKKHRLFNVNCRAMVGVVGGGGRNDKPFVKAGKKHHAMKARRRLFPKTSAVAMNAVDHPFGSGRGRHMGKSSVAPRHAPPGRNVGQIRARRTGRRR